jgi:hypothetical protein
MLQKMLDSPWIMKTESHALVGEDARGYLGERRIITRALVQFTDGAGDVQSVSFGDLNPMLVEHLVDAHNRMLKAK